jgi:peptidoglycan/xylan/chitin deacetylase (PgdA/CDA1 family)
VIAPILLYHHIGERSAGGRYTVSAADFEAQMLALRAWGYTPIPISRLAAALAAGASLPRRPVVITFDDGYQDVYTHAFPVMHSLGYPGVVYVISQQVGVGGYLNVEQLQELAAAGWEIGSHTRTHTSLRAWGANLEREIAVSRQELETMLQAPVSSFSFPYGLTSQAATQWVKDSGYTAAVGLGGLASHSLKTLYYLSRIEIQGNMTWDDFARLLRPAGGAMVLDDTTLASDGAR